MQIFKSYTFMVISILIPKLKTKNVLFILNDVSRHICITFMAHTLGKPGTKDYYLFTENLDSATKCLQCK